MEKVLVEGKNFRLLQEEELERVCEFLNDFLPDAIKFHQTLRTFLKDRVWEFYFYVNKEWPENPVILHFPGMTKTINDKMYESFSVFCPCDQLKNLEILRDENVLIDWSKPIYLNFTHSKIMEKIEEFYREIGSLEKMIGEVFVQSESIPENTESELIFSEDAEMMQLKKEHVKIIYELYPANHMECVEVFEKLVEKLPCYGIFAQSGELAAWMVQSYYGAMFSMQTKPDFRRKGYGLILAKYLSQIVRQRGYLPFVVIRPENDASKGLYTKLGFRKHFETVRAILHPFGHRQDDTGEVS